MSGWSPPPKVSPAQSGRSQQPAAVLAQEKLPEIVSVLWAERERAQREKEIESGWWDRQSQRLGGLERAIDEQRAQSEARSIAIQNDIANLNLRLSVEIARARSVLATLAAVWTLLAALVGFWLAWNR